MLAWLASLLRREAVRSAVEETHPVDKPYWDMVLQNIADIRVWLAQVERNAQHAQAHAAAPAKPETTSVDEEIAAADSVTRIHKAMEREWHVDRRTVYQRVERVVHAFGIERKVPDWRTNVEFHRELFSKRDGERRIEIALAQLQERVSA